jgi:hypothetical protein
MPTFEIERVDEVRGEVPFFRLFRDGVCQFSEFWNDCLRDAVLKKELVQIQTRMEYIANRQYNYLDKTKFRELTGRASGDLNKDYEIKTKHLRVYFTKDENGNILIVGGTKKDQKSDIKRMRTTKSEYFKAR